MFRGCQRLATCSVLVIAMGVLLLLMPGPLRAEDTIDIEQLGKTFDEQFEAKDFASAEQTVSRMRKLCEAVRPAKPLVLARAVHRQAKLMAATGRDAKAEQMYKWVRQVREAASQQNLSSDELEEVLYELHGVLIDFGLFLAISPRNHFDEAAPIFDQCALAWEKDLALTEQRLGKEERVLADMKKQFGADDQRIAKQRRDVEARSNLMKQMYMLAALNYAQIGSCWRIRLRFVEAERFHRRGLEIIEKKSSGDSTFLPSMLLGLGSDYTFMARYTEAEPLLKRCLALFEMAGRASDPLGLNCLATLGVLYHEEARYAEAEGLLSDVEKRLRPDQPGAIDVVGQLAHVYCSQARYAEAEALILRWQSLVEKSGNTEGHTDASPEGVQARMDLAHLRGELARVYYHLGKFAEVERIDAESIAELEELVGPENPAVAEAQNNRGQTYLKQGRYAEAEPLLKMSIPLMENTLGKEHPDLAGYLCNLAELYTARGLYAEAEPLYRRAQAIQQKLIGTHPRTADTLTSLAYFYCTQGREAEAETLYRRAQAMREKVFGKDHPAMVDSLCGLANVLRSQHKYSEVEPLLIRAVKVAREAFGPIHPAMANPLSVLARAEKEQQHFSRAEAIYLRFLDLSTKIFGPNYPGLASELVALADLYDCQGQHEKAEPLVERAIVIGDRAGTAPGDRYEAYLLRARINWKLQRRSEGLGDLRQAMLLAEQQRAHAAGTERERAQSFQSMNQAFEQMVVWQSELGDINEVVNAIERAHSRSLLDEIAHAGVDLDVGRSAVEREQSRQRESQLKQAVASCEKQLEALAVQKGGPQVDLAKQRQEIEVAAAQARKELYAHFRDQRSSSPIYRNLLAVGSGPPRLSQIQQRLVQADSLALIYFLAEDNAYLTVIGPRKEDFVRLVADAAAAKSLGIEAGPLTAKKLGPVFANAEQSGLLQQLSHPKTALTCVDKLAALWTMLIPEPYRQSLTDGSVKRLLVVPDGPLALLPLETLVVKADDDPTYLLDVGPSIHYAPSATVLFNLLDRQKGSIVPDREPVLAVGDPAYPLDREKVASANSALEAIAAPQLYRAAGGTLRRLPHSAIEVAGVTQAFQGQGIAAAKLTDDQATKANVRSQMPGRRVIHLACHGCVDNTYGNFFGALSLVPGKEASGTPADDGFLTLSEIYHLDLSGCELTILSACQTNYGPQQEGEGVWALSRGFLVAGSRRVVASNWLVDDKAAASLISYFAGGIAKEYGKQNPVDYARCLREAKRWVREQEQWKSPYYWGTFVLVGPN